MFGIERMLMRIWQKKLPLSDVKANSENNTLQKILRILDRQEDLDSLEDLKNALNKTKHSGPLKDIAFGFDSSVFLKLANHKKSEDIVDYLESRHSAPIILPGQAVQEFWNNHLAVVEKTVDKVKKKFNELKVEVEKIDSGFGNYEAKVQAMLGEFDSEFGYMYDGDTHRRMISLMEFLQRRSVISYVSRSLFSPLAEIRKKTRTPPGFKDEGHGDFFIWTEFLAGLLREKENGAKFSHAILLTNDVKQDWSTDGIAHPILTAEVRKLLGVTFDVWTIDKLRSEIDAEVNQS